MKTNYQGAPLRICLQIKKLFNIQTWEVQLLKKIKVLMIGQFNGNSDPKSTLMHA